MFILSLWNWIVI